MKKSFKILASILVALCVTFGSVGFTPGTSSTSSPPVAKAASKTMYIKWNKVKVRKTKSETAAVVQTLRRNKKVQVLSESGDWARIKTPSGKKGYVLKKQLCATSVKSRMLKALKKEWAILEPALAENGWEIFDDEGYKYDSGLPGYFRLVWAAKGADGDYLTIKVHISASATSHGGIDFWRSWSIFDDDKSVANDLSGYASLETIIKNLAKY